MTTDQLNEILAHHGTKGQMWGVKNGPPYPLDKKKVEAKNKEEAIRSGKASVINKFRDEMTNEEIRRAIERVRLYNDLDNLTLKELGIDTKKVSIKDVAKKISPTLKTGSAIIDTALKIKKLKIKK